MQKETGTRRLASKFGQQLIAGIAALLVCGVSAAAQAVVVGTGNPSVDIPAVQAAVNQGGGVVLKGHFSFHEPPTIPTALPGYPAATILVSKAVTISGAPAPGGQMPTIEGGTVPFYVDAPGARVVIRAVRFVRPTTNAIFVYAVSGLTVASCEIDGIVPLANTTSTGIKIATVASVPTPRSPGKPQNVSGTLQILNNRMDIAGGTASDNTIGVLIFSVGVPGAEVEAHVSGNKITNTTAPAINLRRVSGRAYIDHNVITTGTIASTRVPGSEVIRAANIGTYLIAHNSIDCGWADPEAKGIGVFSQFGAWPLQNAVVVDNDVNMDAPAGTVFGSGSAGIDVRGFAQGNSVTSNRTRGRARAALSVEVFKGGAPNNNAFLLNRFGNFQPSLADIYVGPGVMNTRIVGTGTIDDLGTGTAILPVP